MIASPVLQRIMLGVIIARIGRNLGMNQGDIDRAATMAREATRAELARAWLTRLADQTLVLLDFNREWDLARAKRFHESGQVVVSQPLSEIVDDVRAALTDALQTDEMQRTTNESY